MIFYLSYYLWIYIIGCGFGLSSKYKISVLVRFPNRYFIRVTLYIQIRIRFFFNEKKNNQKHQKLLQNRYILNSDIKYCRRHVKKKSDKTYIIFIVLISGFISQFLK